MMKIVEFREEYDQIKRENGEANRKVNWRKFTCALTRYAL